MTVYSPDRRSRTSSAIACYLDGVEVCNRNPRHENNNERAEEYAALQGLLRTGGSDCHRQEDIGQGGILARTLPENGAELVRLLRSGEYTVIARGAKAAMPMWNTSSGRARSSSG